MDYNRENLIRMIRGFPVIWNPDNDDHRSLSKRDDAAKSIGSSFKETKSKEFVLKEWNSMKIYYQSRVRDMEKKRAKTSIAKKPRWEHFDQIHEFLGPITNLGQSPSAPVGGQIIQQLQQNSSNSTEEKFDEFFSDYNEEGMNVNAITESLGAVNESFGAANGGFGAKMIMLSKPNVDEDIQSFLNSIRPTLKKLSVNEEIFEDVKFEINSLLHKKYKESRDQLKEGFQIF